MGESQNIEHGSDIEKRLEFLSTNVLGTIAIELKAISADELKVKEQNIAGLEDKEQRDKDDEFAKDLMNKIIAAYNQADSETQKGIDNMLNFARLD